MRSLPIRGFDLAPSPHTLRRTTGARGPAPTRVRAPANPPLPRGSSHRAARPDSRIGRGSEGPASADATPTRGLRGRVAFSARAELTNATPSRSRVPELARPVLERLTVDRGRLDALRREGLAALASPRGFGVLDTRWLFPEPFGEALRSEMIADVPGASAVFLRVDKNRYRVPKRVPLEPAHADLLRPLFDWTHALLAEAVTADRGAPARTECTFEVRAIGEGSAGEPATEVWHRDGTTFSATLTLAGPTTVVAPVGRFNPEANAFEVDEARCFAPRLGELLVMSGASRPTELGQQGTIHRHAKTTEPQLKLVAYLYAHD